MDSQRQGGIFMFHSPFIKYLTNLSCGLAAMIICSSTGLSQTTAESLIKDMQWRNIGPANMGGRISDVEALDDDFTHVLVASASGGVWKSINSWRLSPG